MARLSFKRHRFPPDVIRHAVWLYSRFTQSFRDVEELLAQRGISVSYETVRCWTIKFGPQIAAKLRHRRAAPSSRWQLDEMSATSPASVRICGAPSMMKARCSISSCRNAAIPALR